MVREHDYFESLYVNFEIEVTVLETVKDFLKEKKNIKTIISQ